MAINCTSRAVVPLCILLTLVSCASNKIEGETIVPESLYDMRVEYDAGEKAFLLEFVSLADEEICIARMSWAAENGGHYFFGERDVYFVSNGVRYDIKDQATGYCTPQTGLGCVHVLKRGDRITGKLRVEDFVVGPKTLMREEFDPQLNLPFSPRFCVAD